jgi:hypothetical protein
MTWESVRGGITPVEILGVTWMQFQLDVLTLDGRRGQTVMVAKDRLEKPKLNLYARTLDHITRDLSRYAGIR